MKNIQIIDGAVNSSFSIYAIPDEAFQLLFPEPKQDIEFLEDAVCRLGKRKVGALMRFTHTSRQNKTEIRGVHGTLFIGLLSRKVFYPNKRETDMDNPGIQRKIKGVPGSE